MNFVHACNLILFLTWSLASSSGIADQPDSIRLWSGTAPEALGDSENARPSILKFSPEQSKQTKTAIVVLPGGGYGHLAMGHEGHQIASWLNENGVHAFICDYRHHGKGYSHPAPMLDAQRAIRTVRSRANEFGIDPDRIGVLGFSAGGHLASTVATHFDDGDANSDDVIERQSSRPDFAILCYPVIALGTSYTHKGSQRNLLGKKPTDEMIRLLSNQLHVTKQTPPTFLWHCSDDSSVPPENSIVFFQALLASGVPAELHIYETGGHGVGLAQGKLGVEDWSDSCLTWMKRRQLLERK